MQKIKKMTYFLLDLLQESKNNQMLVLVLLSLINSKIIENSTYTRGLLYQ